MFLLYEKMMNADGYLTCLDKFDGFNDHKTQLIKSGED